MNTEYKLTEEEIDNIQIKQTMVNFEKLLKRPRYKKEARSLYDPNIHTVDNAVQYNCLETVKWLYNTKKQTFEITFPNNILCCIIVNNNIIMLKWFFTKEMIRACGSDTIIMALDLDSFEIVKFLYLNMYYGSIEKVINNAILNKQVDIIRWLYDNYDNSCESKNRKNYLENVKKYLNENEPKKPCTLCDNIYDIHSICDTCYENLENKVNDHLLEGKCNCQSKVDTYCIIDSIITDKSNHEYLCDLVWDLHP